MSHFTVLVIGDNPEAQLAPYHEFECTGINDEFVQSVDITEEVLETQKRDDMNLAEIAEYYGFEEAQYEHEEVAMEHFGDTAKWGYLLIKDDTIVKAVRRTNPNSKWDWYQLGGRWAGFFPLKADGVGEAGEPGIMTEGAPAGYVDSAYKKHIDFDRRRKEAAEEAGESWNKVHAVIDPHLENFTCWSAMLAKHGIDTDNKEVPIDQEKLQAARDEFHAQPLQQAMREASIFLWNGIDPYLTTLENYKQNAYDRAITTFAIVKDGVWYERGEMGFWGIVSNEKDEDVWDVEFKGLIEGLPDDTLLSVYDCHI